MTEQKKMEELDRLSKEAWEATYFEAEMTKEAEAAKKAAADAEAIAEAVLNKVDQINRAKARLKADIEAKAKAGMSTEVLESFSVDPAPNPDEELRAADEATEKAREMAKLAEDAEAKAKVARHKYHAALKISAS